MALSVMEMGSDGLLGQDISGRPWIESGRRMAPAVVCWRTLKEHLCDSALPLLHALSLSTTLSHSRHRATELLRHRLVPAPLCHCRLHLASSFAVFPSSSSTHWSARRATVRAKSSFPSSPESSASMAASTRAHHCSARLRYTSASSH